MMNEIKFSDDYEKLPSNWNGSLATLVALRYDRISEIKRKYLQFLNYDTKYRGREGHYRFETDDVIILFFVHKETGKVFTTIRKYNIEKFTMYQELLDTDFKLVRTE